MYPISDTHPNVSMGKDVTVCCICDQKKLSQYEEWDPYDTIVGWSEDYEVSMMFLHDLTVKSDIYVMKISSLKDLKKKSHLVIDELELVFDGTSYIPRKYLNDYFAAPNKMKELYDGTLTLLNYLVAEEELTKKEEKAIEKAIDIVKDFREEYLDSQLTGCDLDSLEENHQLTEEWRAIIQNTKA